MVALRATRPAGSLALANAGYDPAPCLGRTQALGAHRAAFPAAAGASGRPLVTTET